MVIQNTFVQSICADRPVAQMQKKMVHFFANTIIAMQIVAKNHKAIIQDIVCSINAVNVVAKKKMGLIIVKIITVLGAVAKQINIKIVVIAMHINVATRIVQIKNKIVLQAM